MQSESRGSMQSAHSNNCRKLCLLLWKNTMLQRRHLFSTFCEFFLPLVLAALLMSVRMASLPVRVSDPIFYDTLDITQLPADARPLVKATAIPIVYSPNTPIINEVVDNVAMKLQVNISKFGFANEEDLEKHIETNKEIDYLAGLSFKNMESNFFTKKISFKIRLKTKVRANSNNPMVSPEGWMTQQMFPVFPRPGPRSEDSMGPSPYYYHEGFLSIQHAVVEAILEILKKKSTIENIPTHPKIQMRLFPTPPYNKDKFIVSLQTWLPVIFLISFLFSSLNIIRSLVSEKEKKIKESMKMMGLSNWLHWSAWFIKSFIFLFLSATLMTVLLTVKMKQNVAVITYTDFGVIIFFLSLYIGASITFCCAISAFFSRTSSAVTAAGLLYFFSYVPYMYIQPRYLTLGWEVKTVFCLLPNTAMGFGGQFITMFEGAGIGLHWNNISSGATPDDNLSMLWILIMLIVDIILYAIIAWYVDNIFPGEFGVPRPWYFPATRSYWFGTVPIEDLVTALDEKATFPGEDKKYFEREPVRLPAGIQIRKLTKVFKKKIVVNNISMNIYEGQITVLLGHNGAGKTTTMSMLTGLLTPTKGTAFVHGYDITTDMKGVRSSLGLCPQHDVLFDELNVVEHLKFFYKLKGCPKKLQKQEVNRIIDILKMEDVSKNRVSTLSAGMRRKLSVGIAFIGGSKVVLLDEPTSGMDPAARRATWDMLQTECAGRTVLVTTHFMDEADILGDRVAIMAEGEIRCFGSPLFLKKLFGRGYQLIIIKHPDCNVIRLTEALRHFIPQALLSRLNGAELTYILPYKDLPAFPLLFEHLEGNKELLAIAGFGISMTTMEEVFFRVGEDTQTKYRIHKVTDTKPPRGSYEEYILNDENEYELDSLLFRPDVSSSIYNLEMKMSNRGLVLILQQFFALLVKKITHTRRNVGLLLLQLFIPMIFVTIALILAKLAPKAENEPPVELSLKLFSETVIPFAIVGTIKIKEQTETTDKLAELYTQHITGTNQLKYIGHSDDMKFIDYFVLKMGVDDPMLMQHKCILGATIANISGGETMIIAHFNDEPYHSSAISLNLVENAVFRYVLNDPEYLISVINHPLPTTKMTETYQGQATSIGFDVAFNLVFGLAILASSFVIFLIKERETNAKHLQFVSGVNFLSFWISTFLWDYVNFIIPCLGIMLMFLVFQQKEYIDQAMLGHFFLVFVLYGWSTIPMMYIFSFLFKESSTGFTNLAIFNLVTGVGCFIASIMLYVPELKMSRVADMLQWAFLPLPNYSLAWAFFNLYKNYVAYQSCTSSLAQEMCSSGKTHPCCKKTGNCGPDGCLKYTSDYLDWEYPGIGRMLTFMAIVGGVSMLLLLLLELRLASYIEIVKWKTRRMLDSVFFIKPVDEEDDVKKERERIETTPIASLVGENIVIMKNLTKYYGTVLAVNNLSIGIPRRECFGLLGTTGAGKTTIFKMLTGDTVISQGDAYLESYSATKNIKKARKLIGYCPQFDAIIEQMTGRETLTMFARLRGVPEGKIPELVEALAKSLMFKEHINKQAKNYSGGNRRKLSTAVAMIGNPPIVFLDEPTTGIDPVSRRMLWDSLCKLRDSGCSITLTTHSMEECEALCTRLAILVQGSFCCLGSPQHLKNKFGQAYTLIAKVKQPSRSSKNRHDLLTALCQFVESTFEGSELQEMHQGVVYYAIKNPSLSLANIFSTMESIKEQYNVEDYSVSQTTLEDVFLNFVKAATRKTTRLWLSKLDTNPNRTDSHSLPATDSTPSIRSVSVSSKTTVEIFDETSTDKQFKF